MLANGMNPVPPGKIAASVTFLDLDIRPQWLADFTPNPDVSLERQEQMALPDYRSLFREIGENWLWTSRLCLSDDELSDIIHGNETAVNVVKLNGETAGLSELKRVNPTTVEVAFFGLKPGFTGRKIGKDAMALSLIQAWREDTTKVFLQTCNFDHPAALGFYRKCGFEPVRFGIELMDDPRIAGTLPKNVAPHVPLLNNDLGT